MRPRRISGSVLLAGVVIALCAAPAEAYIGPGAGFALASSLFVILWTILLALLSLLLWPLRWVIREVRGRRAFSRAKVKRVVVLGLDGMEPTLAEQYMAEGRLPNLSKLAKEGSYGRLGTTLPAMTPVAWSTFMTGCNPGKHNVFDFLAVDRRNYLPMLSSVQLGEAKKTVRLGKYRLPISKPDVRLLRKGRPLWSILGEHGIFSTVVRMPITFPPERFRGVALSAMCVPDLRGTQGTFSFYTTRPETESIYAGGEQVRVQREGRVIRSHLVGPANALRCDHAPMTAPFTIRLGGGDGDGAAVLELGGDRHVLQPGVYTPWIRFHFKAAPWAKVHGICQFLLLATEPEFELYVTPLQIDPEKPALPISHPRVFSTYLAKAQGPFATMGLAEDTWAHNERILQDPGFLHQCVEADQEREVMFFDALAKTKRGLVACVFDGTDRVQHMFWRYLDPQHPARTGFGVQRLTNAIREHFERMDALVGRAVDACGEDSLLLVISDHGCKSFRRGVDLNRWLINNGYMKLQEPPAGRKYLATVDWSQTRAYALGLSGIHLNLQGRERQGIVQEGPEADGLREELCAKLTGLTDEHCRATAVNKAYNTRKCYAGPYREEAPDVIVGYNEGYRVSWEAALGDITDEVFHDNLKAWSGDHCIDPRLAPGVMFCNHKIHADAPHIMDLAPTILELFGVSVPPQMDGRPLRIDLPENGRTKTA